MAKKYKPLADLTKEALRVRLNNTCESLLHRASGLEVSASKLREAGLLEAGNECQNALIALMRAHGRIEAYIEDLEGKP